MTHLDLFTGIGGFHLAAEWAGFETIGFSEIEPYCCQLLAEKWPDIRNYGDIRTADFSEFRGSITILSAGVPCQPASLAGKRRGEADDRWLWPAVLDVVGSVRPAWCLFENPPGILTLDEFGGVLLRLESLGYAVRAFSVPANAVGAKHRRQRVFIVAHANMRSFGAPDGWGGAVGSGVYAELERSGQDSEALADAVRAGYEPDTGTVPGSNGQERPKGDHRLNGSGEALANTDRAGLEKHESRQQRQLSTLIGSSGPLRFRLTEPPLCGRADGIPDRSHRLKALGNAVVPQQAYPFFAAIAQVINR